MSDQADKAAREIRALMPQGCEPNEETIAQIIRSTVTAPELVEAAKRCARYLEYFLDGIHYPTITKKLGGYEIDNYKDSINALRSALSAQEPKVCPDGACPSCWGTGHVMHSHINQCSTCHGTGVIKIKES